LSVQPGAKLKPIGAIAPTGTTAPVGTIPIIMASMDETFDVGLNLRTPVDDKDYQVPFRFTGEIAKLTFKLREQQLAARLLPLHPCDLDRYSVPLLRRTAHGLGGCLHPHTGDAGVYRRPGPRHHHRPGAASARDPRHVWQLL